jgi:hypothetical protein
MLKWILKNKIIIWHPNSKLEKVLPIHGIVGLTYSKLRDLTNQLCTQWLNMEANHMDG